MAKESSFPARAWAKQENIQFGFKLQDTAIEQWAGNSARVQASDSVHPSASTLALAEGKDLAVLRSQKVRFVDWSDIHSTDPYFFIDWGEDSFALELPVATKTTFDPFQVFAEALLLRHKCLLGDCAEAAYLCDSEHGYCDEVSFVAQHTGRSVSVPTSIRDKWDVQAKTVPILRARQLIDRFGAFPKEVKFEPDEDWRPEVEIMREWATLIFEHRVPWSDLIDSKLGLSYWFQDVDSKEPRTRGVLCGSQLRKLLKMLSDRGPELYESADCESAGETGVLCRYSSGMDHGQDQLLIFDLRNGRPLIRGYADIEASASLCSHSNGPCPYTHAHQTKDMISRFRRQRPKRCN